MNRSESTQMIETDTDVQLSTRDVQLSTRDVQLSTRDVQLSTRDVQLSTRDVQLSTGWALRTDEMNRGCTIWMDAHCPGRGTCPKRLWAGGKNGQHTTLVTGLWAWPLQNMETISSINEQDDLH